MANAEVRQSKPGFYFSLPRLFALLTGRGIVGSENNLPEAWCVSLAIYFVSYFFTLQFIPRHLPLAVFGLVATAALFAVWIFWLLVLCINSHFIRLLRSLGLFQDTLPRRAQGFFVIVETTAMAGSLLLSMSQMRFVGALWIAAVAANSLAALLLIFFDGSNRTPS